MSEPKMTAHTQELLHVLLGRRTEEGRRHEVLVRGLYGLELSKITGLPNGTLFPALERLRQAGWVERYWEQDEVAEAEGRPRRRYFKLSEKGAQEVPHALAEALARESFKGGHALRPGLAGGF
ncbi:PadR family transcriptional regulator [Lentzea sp. PSKA42]|uniref:PadR family transcriptional regulator n=1 Tax=Lentzea indica TaxID=2604800 RepID=A0ABX1F919_9PSEU|nr:helix-turn-helix transcriptional regulator [Lentzea indica]NKE55386.1 PadR family transcriptional regulator [Lentzea indica]